MNDVKLGALCWNQYTDWASLLEVGKRADRLGYDTLWTCDQSQVSRIDRTHRHLVLRRSRNGRVVHTSVMCKCSSSELKYIAKQMDTGICSRCGKTLGPDRFRYIVHEISNGAEEFRPARRTRRARQYAY